MRKKSRLIEPSGPKTQLITLIRENAQRHRIHEVFSDFVELSALSVSNAVDKPQFEAREARYLQIIKRYDTAEVERFAHMFAVLVNWLECGFADCLGELFMSLEFGDHWKGQFFTPYNVSSMMARMLAGDVRGQVQRQGFVTVCEPACGAGGMLIAFADAIAAEGINYQQVMHATAIDVDATAVHMTYLQLALLHVPAIVVHGNALALQPWSHWATPAHVLGGWDRRLHDAHAAGRDRETPFAVLELVVPDPLTIEPVTFPAPSPERIRDAVIVERIEQMSLFG